MNRFLQYLNFFGVAILGVVCAVQWRVDSRLNMELIELEKTRVEQLGKLAEQEKTIHGYAADLDDFRQRLTLSENQLKEFHEKLIGRTRERDDLKITLDKWMAALAARDEALKRIGQELKKVSAERNDAVGRLNDLSTKYNAMIRDTSR